MIEYSVSSHIKQDACWISTEKGSKSVHQSCWDGILFIYLYFLEREPKIVGVHLYNWVMKMIMRSKYQELGLGVLIYKLVANSNEMVDVSGSFKLLITFIDFQEEKCKSRNNKFT